MTQFHPCALTLGGRWDSRLHTPQHSPDLSHAPGRSREWGALPPACAGDGAHPMVHPLPRQRSGRCAAAGELCRSQRTWVVPERKIPVWGHWRVEILTDDIEKRNEIFTLESQYLNVQGSAKGYFLAGKKTSCSRDIRELSLWKQHEAETDRAWGNPCGMNAVHQSTNIHSLSGNTCLVLYLSEMRSMDQKLYFKTFIS